VRTVFAPKLFEIPFISIITEKSPFQKALEQKPFSQILI